MIFLMLNLDWINHMETASVINKKELRTFGISIGIILITIFNGILPWVTSKPFPTLPLIMGILLIILSIIFPNQISIFYRMWIKIGTILGWINTRILLYLIYFLIFTPFGLTFRLLGKDKMQKNKFRQLSVTTYRIESEEKDPKEMGVPY
jgi:hypothetical protein